jgi:long-chain acyl-CoA synthetase
MDDGGAIVADGVVGEIVHRGPNAMIGYIKDQPATTAASGFGWHHTGDLGLIDPDGQLLFVDRKKDMIKSGGENVASVKVEEVLLRHPAVANAAVVGLPHPRWTEAVAGFVTLKPGQSADPEAIIAHCRTHLSGYETPKLVAILDKFQTTVTGKIQKNSLRDEYRSWFATLTDANTRTPDPNIRSTDGRDRGGC